MNRSPDPAMSDATERSETDGAGVCAVCGLPTSGRVGGRPVCDACWSVAVACCSDPAESESEEARGAGGDA